MPERYLAIFKVLSFTSNSLKRFRKELNLTQKQVSDAIGIQTNAYQAYEYGKVKPSTEILYKIAKAFNVSTDYLLGINEAKNQPEIYLLNIYRNLDENNRRTLTDMANFLNMKQSFSTENTFVNIGNRAYVGT